MKKRKAKRILKLTSEMLYKGIQVQLGVDPSNKFSKLNENNEKYFMFDKYPIKEDWVICSSKNIFVFLSYKPYLPLHLLIVPFEIHTHYTDYTPEIRSELLTLISFMQNVLSVHFNKAVDECSFHCGLQDGVNAGQTVSHCHFHLQYAIKEYMNEESEVYKKLVGDGYIKDGRKPFTRAQLLISANELKEYIKKLDI